jgi:hypothetical protein
MEKDGNDEPAVLLDLGTVDVARESTVSIKPERLFGRHCAILGATGGGKSWTTARIVEECLRYRSKIILIDATGEYRGFAGAEVEHCHLGEPVEQADGSTSCSLPPTSFVEPDFLALFEPAGKVQGPKMRAAMKSLRLARLKPALALDGYIRKHNQLKKPVVDAEREVSVSSKLDDPRQPFEVSHLVEQIEQECVWPNGGSQREPDYTRWGACDENGISNCLPLFARINGVLTSPAFKCVFASTDQRLTERIDDFAKGDGRLLRICLSGIAYEFSARETIANVIGRYLLTKARAGVFLKNPVVVVVDEAHNFLGRQIGVEDYAAKLDAFELMAKEGRKYGVSICLVSQRPRDITEGVLSQMGTLVVHRLTNDQDREVVERACGEIDRSASAFLPNLRPGEAVIIGADLPIPLTIQVREPETRPRSYGPDFQEYWGKGKSAPAKK